jgi:hypothetical protein
MLRRFVLSSVTAFALVALPCPAHAQVESSAVEAVDESPPNIARASSSSSPSSRPEPATESYWYGWQTLTVDAASVAVIGTGIATRSEPVGWLGAGGIYLGAPIVHISHGRVGMAFASLGVRLGLPSAGVAIGYASAGACPEANRQQLFGCVFHGWSEAFAGGLIGLGTAMAIDAALFTHGKRAISPPRESGVPRLTSVAPSYDPSTRSAAFGVGGTF